MSSPAPYFEIAFNLVAASITFRVTDLFHQQPVRIGAQFCHPLGKRAAGSDQRLDSKATNSPYILLPASGKTWGYKYFHFHTSVFHTGCRKRGVFVSFLCVYGFSSFTYAEFSLHPGMHAFHVLVLHHRTFTCLLFILPCLLFILSHACQSHFHMPVSLIFACRRLHFHVPVYHGYVLVRTAVVAHAAGYAFFFVYLPHVNGFFAYRKLGAYFCAYPAAFAASAA